jgi:hypothetical protein
MDESEGIRCGCGFSANTGDNSWDYRAHEDHVRACPNRQPSQRGSWIGEVFGAIFSFWGMIIVSISAGVIVTMLRK